MSPKDDTRRGKAPELTIVDTQPLSEGWAKLSRVTFDLRRNDGDMQRHVHEIHHHGSAVALLPYNAQRASVVLIRQFRLPPWLMGDKTRIWEACAGLLDGDEAPEDCARREIVEETGYRALSLTPLGRVYSSPGSLTESMHLFLAEIGSEPEPGAGGGLIEEGEDIEVFEIPFAEALQMIEAGQIIDAKTQLLLRTLQTRQPDLLGKPDPA